MGNKKSGLSSNFITILGVAICFVIVAVSYNRRIEASTKPVVVPYAKQQIKAGTQITKNLVGKTKIPSILIDKNVITRVEDVIDKYANADTSIPEGSLFYKRTVVEKRDLPANIILEYPTGSVLYNMKVDAQSTYGNSIQANNYIDVYLKVEATAGTVDNTFVNGETREIMLGKLFSNIEVLAVKDSDGNLIEGKKDKDKTPAMIIFALPEEYFILLKKCEYLRMYSAKLIPVPTNQSMEEEPGEITLSSDDLKNWINKVTYWTNEG